MGCNKLLFTIDRTDPKKPQIKICGDYFPPAFLHASTNVPDITNRNISGGAIRFKDLEAQENLGEDIPLGHFEADFITGGRLQSALRYECDDTCQSRSKAFTKGFRVGFVTMHIKSLALKASQEGATHPQLSMSSTINFSYPMPNRSGSLDASFNDTGFVGIVSFEDPVNLEAGGQTVSVDSVALQLSDTYRRVSARGSVTIKQLAGVSVYFREAAVYQDRLANNQAWKTHFDLEPDVYRTSISAFWTLLGLFVGSKVIH